MKKMKKLLGLLLAVTMIMGLTMTALAADTDTYSITIENEVSGHIYEAYQIFKGDLADGKLSNIEWGNGVTAEISTVMGDAETKAAALTDETAAKTFAAQIIPYLNSEAARFSKPVEGGYRISELEAGYYLIKDQDNSLTGDSSAYTSYILRVSANEKITPKSSVPTSHKKVDDINDSTTSESGGTWQDSADYDIEDEVPFQLTGTLPANYGDYTVYKMIFHDEQSAGLTFNLDSVKVYVNTLGVLTEVKTGYTVKENTACSHEKCTFEVELTDVRNLYDAEGDHIAVTPTSIILVEYTSTLNENAKIGSDGNPNTMYMEYYNNPNNEQGGEMGSTQKDTVIVFTYKAVINKVDENKKALPGAAFKLEKKLADESWKEIKVTEGDTTTTFEFNGLDDGIYRLSETETPAGYNTIDPIMFEVIAAHDANADNPKLTLLNSNQVDENGLTITENILFSATTELTDGSITSDIVNKSGATLPTTGGMGTTIFYVLGAILVVGAGVVLITRRRMANR